MKKVVTVGIGQQVFNIEEDAYQRLKRYIGSFEASIADKNERQDVMQDVEARIAELFCEEVSSKNQVVTLALVERVAAIMGTPEGAEPENASSRSGQASDSTPPPYEQVQGYRRFYRNPDDKVIAGVCSGAAAYFRIDPVLARVATGCSLLFGGLGLWVYIILWIAVPNATTVREKLEMRGIPVTAENIKSYSSHK